MINFDNFLYISRTIIQVLNPRMTAPIRSAVPIPPATPGQLDGQTSGKMHNETDKAVANIQ